MGPELECIGRHPRQSMKVSGPGTGMYRALLSKKDGTRPFLMCVCRDC